MPNRLIIHRLDRITLVRKGKARAKHPELREGVVEVVKADVATPAAPVPPKRPSAIAEYPNLGRLALGRVPHEV